jgi:hypothetical protein
MGGCPTPTRKGNHERRRHPVAHRPQRDFLAYLTVITIQPQLKPARSHQRIADALGELAERGEVLLRADDDNVWVIICGRVIVHAARDWLEWATQRWAAAESN